MEKSSFAADPAWQQVHQLLAQRRVLGARTVLASLRTRRGGDDPLVHLLAAHIAWQEDRVREGAAAALAAARVAPADPEARALIADVLIDFGEAVAARDCLDAIDVDVCADPMLLMRIATMRKRLEQHAESLAVLDRAEAVGGGGVLLRFARGHMLVYNGRLDAAEAELASVLAEAPDCGPAAPPLVQLRRQTPEHNYLSVIDAGLKAAAPGGLDAAAFDFARYKTLEDLGRDDEAWQALMRGNATMYAGLRGMPDPQPAEYARFVSAWPFAQAAAGHSEPAGPQPIFIVGLTRSGTTLLERMLSNHPQVADAGELMDFANQFNWIADTRDSMSSAMVARLPRLDYAELGRRYLAETQWRAAHKPHYIDKRPTNWVLVGAIHHALPRAPILNLVRDPMDVCFSNLRAYFGDSARYSYDVRALAAYFNSYRWTMEHWRQAIPGAVLDVRYAELVRDPEATLRKVFAFCGLAFEPGCSDLARNAAPSASLSASQVRGAIQGDRAERWRRYEAHLGPLQAALAMD